jgi:DNA-binding NarL/FixJ family response regulator
MRRVREVLRLKFVGGVSTREIALRVGVAASTVRANVSIVSCRDRPVLSDGQLIDLN